MSVLIHFSDIPEVKSYIYSLINDENEDIRAGVYTILCSHIEFSHYIAEAIVREKDPYALNSLLWLVGEKMRTEDCLIAILQITTKFPNYTPILQALVHFEDMRAKAYLKQVFENNTNAANNFDTITPKIYAAWGLAKNGNKEAIQFLQTCMEKDDEHTFRASQALCDTFNWDFEWNRIFIENHRKEWTEKLNALTA